MFRPEGGGSRPQEGIGQGLERPQEALGGPGECPGRPGQPVILGDVECSAQKGRLAGWLNMPPGAGWLG